MYALVQFETTVTEPLKLTTNRRLEAISVVFSIMVISIIRSKIYYVFVLVNDACQSVDWMQDDFLFVQCV